MNFEEMLENREGVATHKESLPMGTFYKKLIDKKYRNVLELSSELTDSIVFCEALKADAKFTDTLHAEGQLHFTPKEDSNGIYELELEQGSYQTFEQLLTQNPAVVAGKDYIDKVVNRLAEMLEMLHNQGILQYCLAPMTIFARKSDNLPLLLCHGSLYKNMTNLETLYQGQESYLAPEVLGDGVPDERSDVYALGKFIERLHADGKMSMEYKKVVAKATAAEPAKRYQNVGTMMQDLEKKRKLIHSTVALIAAVAIALFGLFLYFDMMPQTEDIEFVKPVQEEVPDPYDAALTPTELGLEVNDSDEMTEEQRVDAAEMEAELEKIFRRQFSQAAEKTLSKVYSKERMNSSEQNFISSSESAFDDLIKKRDELATQAGLSEDKAKKIADQIISSIRESKQKQLKSYGYQKAGGTEE